MQQPINQYQGYQPQSQTPAPQTQASQQQVKFYKSGIFGFSSAAGRFERDQRRMAAQGWSVAFYGYLGMNFWLRRIIGVTYEISPKQ